MKIRTKITVGYIVCIFLMVAAFAWSNHAGRRLLLENAGRHSLHLTRQMINHIGHELDLRINYLTSELHDGTLQAFLAESNLHFDTLEKRDAHIALQEKTWLSRASVQSLDKPFSKMLRERFSWFLATASGAEIFLTNQYGAIAAQTNETGKYFHADESWWQQAKKGGISVQDMPCDEGARPGGLAIALRVDGPNGNFAGVLKAMVPIGSIIRDSGNDIPPYDNTKVELFTRKGVQLFSSGSGDLFTDVADQPFFKKLKGQNGYFIDATKRPIQMIAYVDSEGIEGFRGLEWILALKYEKAKILAESDGLQKWLFSIAAIVVLVTLAAAGFISRSIVGPILQLHEASQAVADGNLKKQIKVKGRDEVAQLGCAFNRMTTIFNITYIQLKQKIAACEMAHVLLEENEQRLFQFLDAMPVGVFIVDHTGAPYFANQAAQATLGKGIVVGAGPERLAEVYQFYIAGTDEPYPKDKMPIIQALRGQSATADDMEIHRPDRTIPIMTWASPVFDARGKVLFATAAFSDISEQKQAENMLKATARELKRSNAELEQFAYIASHDLQEPLRKVGSYMELVAERYREQLDQDGREFIDYAVDGARRMKIMINDLLVYSRVGTKGKPFVPTDAAKVMQDVLNDLELTIQDNDARITFDSLPVVTADESQMQQLFRNLIGNAVKYRSQDPPQIHISAQRLKQAWRFSVQDNGIGIEDRFFERIFQIFQRLHGPGRYNGTGIGLAVCKKIVERHGGSISVESTPGRGSTFSFTISDLKEN